MPDKPLDVRLGQAFGKIHRGASLCLTHGLRTPALMLVYAGIDVAGWIDGGTGSAEGFTAWSDPYVKPEERLGCSSDDLYGARCGLLHRGSPDSTLAERGECRQLYYTWGWRSAEDLQTAIDKIGTEDVVAIHADRLLGAFQQGVSDYVRDVRQYPAERKEDVEERAKRIFRDLGDAGLVRFEKFLRKREESDR